MTRSVPSFVIACALALTLVLAAGRSALAADTEMVEVRVTFVAGSTTYLDKGVDDGIRIGDLLELDFPSQPGEPCDAHPDLVDALGAVPAEILRSVHYYLAVFDSEEEVLALHPDEAGLLEIDGLAIEVSQLTVGDVRTDLAGEGDLQRCLRWQGVFWMDHSSTSESCVRSFSNP